MLAWCRNNGVLRIECNASVVQVPDQRVVRSIPSSNFSCPKFLLGLTINTETSGKLRRAHSAVPQWWLFPPNAIRDLSHDLHTVRHCAYIVLRLVVYWINHSPNLILHTVLHPAFWPILQHRGKQSLSTIRQIPSPPSNFWDPNFYPRGLTAEASEKRATAEASEKPPQTLGRSLTSIQLQLTQATRGSLPDQPDRPPHRQLRSVTSYPECLPRQAGSLPDHSADLVQ
jgi:hypothetical protein